MTLRDHQRQVDDATNKRSGDVYDDMHEMYLALLPVSEAIKRGDIDVLGEHWSLGVPVQIELTVANCRAILFAIRGESR